MLSYRHVVELKQESSIPILLSRCEKESNPYIFGDTWIALFVYNKPEVDTLAVEAFEKRC